MSLPSTSYTPPGGYIPQAQQVAQGQPNAVNSVPPPGSPASSFPSDQALGQQFTTANANNVTANLPETRQSMVNTSNIPAMTQNYDDLARQLFEYDQAKLAPQFQGQNPGTPTDAASFGRVDASPLGMTVGSAGLPASSGIFNNNPKFAYQAQNTQANSLLDLLDTLNRGIGSTLGQTKSLYASKTDASQKALDAIINLMQLKQDAVDKAATRASSGGLAGQKLNDAKTRLLADAQKGTTFTDLLKIYSQDGLSPSEIKDIYNQVNYYGKPAKESADDIDAILNGQKPAAQAAKDKATQQKSEAYNQTKSAIQNLLDQYNGLNGLEKNPLLGGMIANADPFSGASTYEKQRKALSTVLKDISGAGAGSGVRVTQTEINNWMNLLPQPGDTASQVKTKVTSLNRQLTSKFGVGLDSSYLGNDTKGRPPLSSFDK